MKMYRNEGIALCILNLKNRWSLPTGQDADVSKTAMGGSGKEKNLPHAGKLTLVIQPVASKYTELAKPASTTKYTEK
jgi:hypothetical protein